MWRTHRSLEKGIFLDWILFANIRRIRGHHHTYTDIDGMDYRILLEADFLVNADEGKMSSTAIKAARERFFKTKTGTYLLDSMYLKERETKK